MQKRVWKKIKNVICFALTVASLVGVPTLEAFAATNESSVVEVMKAELGEVPNGYFANLQNARASLTECRIIIDFESSGMGITIFTGTTDVCPIVGVKDVKVEQKVWYGWKTVAVGSGGEVADTNSVAVSMTFTGAIKDETYRVSCVHYADLAYDGVTNYTEGESNTGSFVFTY